MAGVAADVVALAQLAHGEVAAPVIGEELLTLVIGDRAVNDIATSVCWPR